MKEDLDFDNIPFYRLGFDSSQQKEERVNNYMQEIEDIILGSCDNIPEVKNFKSIMNHFFVGEVEMTDRGIYIPNAFNITEENSEEINEVIQNYIEYPDDENLKAEIFTQRTNAKIGNDLSQYGITLDNKYKVAIEGDIFNIHPIFHINDPELFIEFLQKIKICDDETTLYIDTILGAQELRLEKIILESDKISDSSEASNFIIKSFDIWEEIEKLEIEGILINLQIRDIALVTSAGLLEHYLNFKRLGFLIQLYPNDYKNDSKIPSFIYDVLHICNQYKYEEELYNCITAIKENINKSLVLLRNIRNNDILFQPLKEELKFGIDQLIEYIDDNPYIKPEEKAEIISPIIKQSQELDDL